ncbi:hypothetical protein OG828_19500 [Streptomyces sp. NBC_00457]|uniref:hypothetical protein n=1 Tax=Streptomyces sp. NBC_00457 TaxID=2975748 RepID=UPI002E236D14
MSRIRSSIECAARSIWEAVEFCGINKIMPVHGPNRPTWCNLLLDLAAPALRPVIPCR